MQQALERVHQLQATTLGVSLEAPVPRGGNWGSPLGNVFADGDQFVQDEEMESAIDGLLFNDDSGMVDIAQVPAAAGCNLNAANRSG